MTTQRPEPAEYQIKAFGVDRLHHGRVADKHPLEVEWKRLHDRLGRLRKLMREQPASINWKHWHAEAEATLQRREELVDPLRKLGHRVFRRRGGTPTQSHHDIRLQRHLERRAEADAIDTTSDFQGWEAFSAGSEAADDLPPFRHRDPGTGQKTA